jgi:hypothetical protein
LSSKLLKPLLEANPVAKKKKKKRVKEWEMNKVFKDNWVVKFHG